MELISTKRSIEMFPFTLLMGQSHQIVWHVRNVKGTGTRDLIWLKVVDLEKPMPIANVNRIVFVN